MVDSVRKVNRQTENLATPGGKQYCPEQAGDVPAAARVWA